MDNLLDSFQEFIPKDIEKLTKELYDLAFKSKSFKSSKSAALPELIVDGFDTEQIWQQIELENNEEFGRVNLENISKVLAQKDSLELPFKIKKDTESDESEHSENDDENNEAEIESDQSSDESLSETDKPKVEKEHSTTKKRKRTTEVDDKFFKLDDLDEFLRKEDKKEYGEKRKKADDSSEDDDESIDLFNNLSDEDDNEEEDDEGENKKEIKYEDFFDSPDSDNEGKQGMENKRRDIEHEFDDENDNEEYNEETQQQDVKNKKKQVKFDLLNNSDDSDSEEDVAENYGEEKTQTKSSLEARQERLKKIIEDHEKEAISEKPWQLKGETNAANRPQNSLLEEYVEFDVVSRPAPIITEKTTETLEDMIKRRIKDKSWDDVERKIKPVETPMEYKKKLVMNQEKSKESLAQIYENEYIKQREALNADEKDDQEQEEPPEHKEILEMMHSLFRKLDALSNFHYTPKPAKPEMKVISNLPAVAVEEVTPMAMSDATLLAPEEVQGKRKGDLIGKSERTKTDKKRERRKKKKKQQAHAMNQSKQLVDDKKQKKSLKKAAEANKLKGRNIINPKDSVIDDKTVKSSKAFFAQLQDQVTNSIKSKTNTAVSKKAKNTQSAVKLKL